MLLSLWLCIAGGGAAPSNAFTRQTAALCIWCFSASRSSYTPRKQRCYVTLKIWETHISSHCPLWPHSTWRIFQSSVYLQLEGTRRGDSDKLRTFSPPQFWFRVPNKLRLAVSRAFAPPPSDWERDRRGRSSYSQSSHRKFLGEAQLTIELISSIHFMIMKVAAPSTNTGPPKCFRSSGLCPCLGGGRGPMES